MDLKQSLNQVKLVYGAMFIGIVMFLVVSIIVHDMTGIGGSLDVLPDQAWYLIVLIAGVILYMSDILYRKQLGQSGSGEILEVRLNRYRNACILRVALIEVAALCTGIGYLLTGEMLYLIVSVVPLAYFFYTFPKDQNMINDLNLSYSEQQQLGI